MIAVTDDFGVVRKIAQTTSGAICGTEFLVLTVFPANFWQV